MNRRKERPTASASQMGVGELKLKELMIDAGGSTSDAHARSPICCIIGHLHTGKTKLLDSIRGTNVQEGEAGGITQKLGATYLPAENIREKTKPLNADSKELKIPPGLVLLDTPGHVSFTELRNLGVRLCDIAILAVDIMDCLQPHTLQSFRHLRMREKQFIIALNKVDRLPGWKVCRNAPFDKAIEQQSEGVREAFNIRLKQIITQFLKNGLRTALFSDTNAWSMKQTYSIVPTSAVSGEGIPDLLFMLVQLTQSAKFVKLVCRDVLQCTVLDVKVIEGHGTTIEVLLVQGVLLEGDQIVVCGIQEPIATTITALLTPHPINKESYVKNKEIEASQCITISAQGLEHVIPGTKLFGGGGYKSLEHPKKLAEVEMQSVTDGYRISDEGVRVRASTPLALFTVVKFLDSPALKIRVSGVGIGPVQEKDVSAMLENYKEYAAILAFDVKVTPEARELADELGVQIFSSDVIDCLFDQFTAYVENQREELKKEAAADVAALQCVVKIIPNSILRQKDHTVVGVFIDQGVAKAGTCLYARSKEYVGKIAYIWRDGDPVVAARRGQKVAIKLTELISKEQQNRITDTLMTMTVDRLERVG